LLTVLIATHNGEKTLPRTLESFLDLEDPRGGWHVVIVDNGSVDSTPDIIDSFTARLPLTHLSEPRTGKNRALNAGLASVQGNLVVFTDDDVIADRRWLSSLRACADERPQYAIIGGPVLPKWPAPPDTWILNSVKLNAVFSVLDREDDGPHDPRLVFGPNMAIRRSVLQPEMRFDESMGPVGNRYAQGDETDLLIRLMQDGCEAWFCSKAVVRHIIRPHHLTEEWILQKGVHWARSQLILESRHPDVYDVGPLASPTSALWRLGPSLALQAARTLYSGAVGEPEHAFRERWKLSLLRGQSQALRSLIAAHQPAARPTLH
jgi:glycosyltransferase involved in cell wall biosynthesis